MTNLKQFVRQDLFDEDLELQLDLVNASNNLLYVWSKLFTNDFKLDIIKKNV